MSEVGLTSQGALEYSKRCLPQSGNNGRFILNSGQIFLLYPRTPLIYDIIHRDELVSVPEQCSLLLDDCAIGKG